MWGHFIYVARAWFHKLLFLWTFPLLSSHAYAGAWPMPKGHGQIIAATVTDNASQGFDDKWKLTQDINFSKFDSQFFWEHGFTDRITLVASTVYQDVDFVSRTGGKTVQGFGTSSLGARYQIYSKGRTVAALQASYLLGGKGEIIADADLGLGGNGSEIRALAGQSFNLFGRDGFADIQTAWVYRSHNAPDTLKTDATIGLGIHENRQMWDTLAVNVIDDANELPNTLRAQIFYLAEFTTIHSRLVLKGTANVQPLIDINTAILRGLTPEVT